MRKLLTILALLSGMALTQTSNYGGVNIGSFSANCIPLAATAITLQCGALSDNGTQIIASPGGDVTRLARTTNPQVLEIYGTTDSNTTPVNYEKLMIGYNALSVQSTYQFVTTKGGTGTNRGVDFFLGAGAFGIGTTVPSRTFTIAPVTGLISTYGTLATAGQGVVPIRGTILAATGQVANAGPTTILTGGAGTAGFYRVCYQASTTTSGSGTTGTVTIAWNDGNAKSFTTGTWALNAVDATGQVNGCQVFRVAASQNITVATTIGSIGTSVYRVDAQAEQLQ